MKLDKKSKDIIKKNGSFGSCAYVYNDGICIRWKEEHFYKKERFSKDKQFLLKDEIKISISHSEEKGFTGRLVFHNPTLLLDGIENIRIYRNNTSEPMRNRNLTCDTVAITTTSGLQINEDIFSFISSDIVIQNEKPMSVTDWENDLD